MMRAGRLVLLGILAAGALWQPALAEGGLPGSPQAVRQVPGPAVALPGADAPAPPAQPASPGGAVFNPFSGAAATPAPRPPAVQGAAQPEEGPGYTLSLAVALACAAAFGWLCRRA